MALNIMIRWLEPCYGHLWSEHNILFLHYYLFSSTTASFIGVPLPFKINLAERLGVAHMPVQIPSCLKERNCLIIM